MIVLSNEQQSYGGKNMYYNENDEMFETEMEMDDIQERKALIEEAKALAMGYIIALTNQMNNDPFNNTFARLADEQFKALKRHSRGVKFNDWTVLYWLEGPGALVELGFMTNDAELKYMLSESGEKALADALSDAIVEFVERLDKMQEYTAEGGASEASAEEVKAEESKSEEPKSEAERLEEGYTIQLLSSKHSLSLNDSQFKGYRGRVVELMGTGSYCYKYCFGSFKTRAEAREELERAKETFKDAYIVHYEGNKIK